MHSVVFRMLHRFYRLVGRGRQQQHTREPLFFNIARAVDRSPTRVASHAQGGGFRESFRRAMQRLPLWNAARMWEVSPEHHMHNPRWTMNLVDFRRLMLTATAEQWLLGRGPFSHIPRTDVDTFLNQVAWNAMTTVDYLLRNYFGHLQLTAGVNLDPLGDGEDEAMNAGGDNAGGEAMNADGDNAEGEDMNAEGSIDWSNSENDGLADELLNDDWENEDDDAADEDDDDEVEVVRVVRHARNSDEDGGSLMDSDGEERLSGNSTFEECPTGGLF